MAATTSYFDRPSPIRPGLSHLQPSPSSPHTPQQRTVSSTLNSPSLSYRSEEDALVFEFGARHFSAGFTGENYPRCKLGFGPEESRRAGDYRRWLPGYNERPRKKTKVDAWGDDHELWRMDLRGCDLGLVEDKIERAVREAYTKHLLVDAKSRRLMLVVPSLMPHQLLSTLLYVLFNNAAMPSITLLSPPILSTVAAGCRSSLVVDIGWRETIVTSVYDYREVSTSRTTQAMRLVTLDMARILDRYDSRKETAEEVEDTRQSQADTTLSTDVGQADEVITRMAWCDPDQPQFTLQPNEHDPTGTPKLSTIREENPLTPPQDENVDPLISIPSPSSPIQPIQIPFSKFSSPVETTLLGNSTEDTYPDDHEIPLPLLIYNSLLSLAPDVRAICMSRIMFTGGGSNIPGLKSRLLSEVRHIVDTRGWSPVIGENAKKATTKSHHHQIEEGGPHHLSSIYINKKHYPSETSQTQAPTAIPPSPASIAPQITDDITTALNSMRLKAAPPPEHSGTIRGLETLGAWAGASLIANLRIKGIVDIDRETFLQHGGVAGARKEEIKSKGDGKAIQRRSLQRGISVSGGEVKGWTLGAWA